MGEFAQQRELILQIYGTFMLFVNQFVIKTKTAWEQEMGVEKGTEGWENWQSILLCDLCMSLPHTIQSATAWHKAVYHVFNTELTCGSY